MISKLRGLPFPIACFKELMFSRISYSYAPMIFSGYSVSTHTLLCLVHIISLIINARHAIYTFQGFFFFSYSKTCHFEYFSHICYQYSLNDFASLFCISIVYLGNISTFGSESVRFDSN